MKQVSLEELLEAGCHFGHQVTRQNPKARDFVFEARDNIHIIDLEKTKEGLDAALAFVQNLAAKDGTLIILGAKRQAQGIVREEVKRAHEAGVDGLFSVTNRWIGGTMTNYSEVAKNFKKLKDLTEKLQTPEKRAGYTKKEISLWDKEKQKLEIFYGGLADMTKIPDAIFIIDTHMEHLAVSEARNMGVKIVGITDTNSDPTLIDYAIPANDDAVGSIKLLTNAIVDTWIEGRKKGAEEKAKNAEKEAKEAEKKKAEPKKEEAPKKAEAKVEKPVKKTDEKPEKKPVKTAKAKLKETKKTPEKISAE